MKKSFFVLICIIVLGLLLVGLGWKNLKTYYLNSRTNSSQSVIAQDNPKEKEELEIKKVLVNNFPNINFKDAELEIRIISDWAFGSVDGKGFVLQKIDNIWELIPDDEWSKLKDRMPEDILQEWGRYMNPGDLSYLCTLEIRKTFGDRLLLILKV